MFSLIFAATLFTSATLAAQETTALERGEYGPLDKAPDSALYDLPVKVSDHVYSAIGATQPPTQLNAGHNQSTRRTTPSDAAARRKSAFRVCASAPHSPGRTRSHKVMVLLVDDGHNLREARAGGTMLT